MRPEAETLTTKAWPLPPPTRYYQCPLRCMYDAAVCTMRSECGWGMFDPKIMGCLGGDAIHIGQCNLEIRGCFPHYRQAMLLEAGCRPNEMQPHLLAKSLKAAPASLGRPCCHAISKTHACSVRDLRKTNATLLRRHVRGKAHGEAVHAVAQPRRSRPVCTHAHTQQAIVIGSCECKPFARSGPSAHFSRLKVQVPGPVPGQKSQKQGYL